VVQQWTLLLVNQKLQENQTAMLIAAALIELVLQRYSQ
jgi:hypothetical protein